MVWRETTAGWDGWDESKASASFFEKKEAKKLLLTAGCGASGAKARND
jgi:hypothetical protein